MKDNYKDLFNINPKYSATSSFILGLVLIDSLTTLEQNAVGEWFILVGQTLVTNSGFQAVIESRISGNRLNINSKEIKSLYNPFIYDIKKVKKLIKKLYPSFQSDIDSVEKILSDLQSKIKDIKKE
jgi:hypothetical protein